MERKEIEIPDNGKVTIDGNKIIIEYEKETPDFKDGDFLVGQTVFGEKWCFILKSQKDKIVFYFYAAIVFSEKEDLEINSWCASNIYRFATEAEKQKLLNALHKENKDWDSKNLKIVEYKSEPKFNNGQFLTHRNGSDRWIIIFKDRKDRGTSPFEYHVMLNCVNDIFYNHACRDNGWHESTEAEKQELLEALHKEGKEWDAEKLQIVDYVWIPKRGERYFCSSSNNDLLFIEMTWCNGMSDDRCFKRGLVFKTKEEAIACAKKMLESIKTKK